MARERARGDDRGNAEAAEGQARGRRPEKKSGGMFGLALVLFVLALVLVLYTMTNKPPAPEPAKAEQVDPFADLPPELPPEKQAKTKGQK
jgi:hypothetical protein